MSEFADVLATLRRARGISPFFALDVGRPSEDWRAGAALLDGPALSGTIGTIGHRYRTDEKRVAASLFFLSYTARLLCPAIAGIVLDDHMLDIRPANLWWRYSPDTGLQVRLAEPATGPGISEAMAPVVDAVRKVVPVARGLLWGNAASAIAGALRTMSRTGTISVEDAEAWGKGLLADPPFTSSGEFRGFPGEVTFRRNSCCLYYRLDGGGTCGDCPLAK